MDMERVRLGKVCSMYNYDNREIQFGNKKTFHKFPRDEIRCRQWVHLCRRADLDAVFKKSGTSLLNKNYVICSDHFRPTEYNNPNNLSQGLKKGTMPSLNLPLSSHQKPTQKRNSRKRSRNTLPDTELLIDKSRDNQVKETAEEKGPLQDARLAKRKHKLPEQIAQQNYFVKALDEHDKNHEVFGSKRSEQELLESLPSSSRATEYTESQIKKKIMIEEVSYEVNQESCSEVKQELIDESLPSSSGACKDTEHLIKKEIKMEEVFDEVKFEDIELKEEPFEEEECQSLSNEPILQGVPMPAASTGEIKKCEKFSSCVHQKFKQFKCPNCSYSSNCKSKLFKHIKAVHLKFKNFKCANCDYSSSYKSNLSAHIKSGLNCNYLSSHQSNLSKHINLVPKKCKPYKCSFSNCEFTTNRKSNLLFHIKEVHLKFQKFKCPYCNYFCYKSNLDNHINLVHAKLKAFKCSNCDFSSNRQSNLNAHIKSVHQKIKPFKCHICDYVCSRKAFLLLHIKSIHEKLNTFKCPRPNCGFSCSQKCKLSMHIKSIHEKYIKVKCPNCDYACSNIPYLARHIKSVHLK